MTFVLAPFNHRFHKECQIRRKILAIVCSFAPEFFDPYRKLKKGVVGILKNLKANGNHLII
jgi:hypothetical protein